MALKAASDPPIGIGLPEEPWPLAVSDQRPAERRSLGQLSSCGETLDLIH